MKINFTANAAVFMSLRHENLWLQFYETLGFNEATFHELGNL